ncbi:MAG: DinB family protein [Anaerolineaceae bacterium]
MSTVNYIQRSLAFAHRALTDARNGTAEQLHFVPEHGSHSIAWCLWHTARVEDLIVSARILRQPQVWDERWAERIGVPFEGFGTGQSDAEAQQIQLKDLAAFCEYQDAVWLKTDQLLASATDEELEREMPTRTGSETVGEAISLHMLGHFNGHRGEINTLRGMQGMPPVLVIEGTH